MASVTGGQPRLHTMWRLYGARTEPGHLVVGVHAFHLICRGSQCAEVAAGGAVAGCRTGECEEFIGLVLGGREFAVIAVAPSRREPSFALPVELAEVEEVVKEAGTMPGCACKFSLINTPFMLKLEGVLAGALRLGGPKDWERFYVVDGGLVALTAYGVFTVCFRPECDRTRCAMLARTPLCPKSSMFQALMEMAEELFKLAQRSEDALLGFLATLV